MNVVKLFVSLMILFVAVNFIIAIYRFANRRWREGLENATSCPSGCTAPKELRYREQKILASIWLASS